MRVIYMGTPDFAVPSLQKVFDDGHEILAVFTQPDKPQGRKMVMTPPEVKVRATELGIEVFQPNTLKDDEVYNQILELNPDVIVVVAYGKLLPERILNIPKYGCINVHGSLLPKYRGAAPIQWSVINGDKFAGVTTMYMAKGLDAGDMLLKYSTEILPEETSGELYERLKIEGAELLSKTLVGLLEKTIERQPQNEDEVTLAPMLSKEISVIDFSKNAQTVHNLVRGMNPWPVAYTYLEGQLLKVFKTRVLGDKTSKPSGTVLVSSPKEGLHVACSDGTIIEILEVQLITKKRMAVSDFLRGKPIEEGTILGISN